MADIQGRENGPSAVLTCPVCGANDHERLPSLFGLFPVILCPELEEQRIVLAPPESDAE